MPAAEVPGTGRRMDEVMVSPEVWKLPALSDRVLKFVKNDMLVKIAEGGANLEAGGMGGGSLSASSASRPSDDSDEDDEFDDIDTTGILAGDGGSDMDFNPEDVIAQANAGGDDFNPEDLIAQLNAEEDGGEESGFDPEDVIKD